MRDGDANTKFFHAVTSARCKKNTITRLMNDNGDYVEDQRGLCMIVQIYFEDHFKSQDASYDSVISTMNQKIMISS